MKMVNTRKAQKLRFLCIIIIYSLLLNLFAIINVYDFEKNLPIVFDTSILYNSFYVIMINGNVCRYMLYPSGGDNYRLNRIAINCQCFFNEKCTHRLRDIVEKLIQKNVTCIKFVLLASF